MAWNEGGREGGRGAGIEEFWWLAPAGVTVGENEDDAQRHLCLAFFDILHLDGESLLDKQYAFRRRMLRQVVRDIQGFVSGSNVGAADAKSFLAKTATISLTPGRINAEQVSCGSHSVSSRQELRRVFQKCCDQREEGLVLKADTSTYNDTKLRWVKLKVGYRLFRSLTRQKDYIPNLGDCVDLVVLGAGWDIERARELRGGLAAPPSLN